VPLIFPNYPGISWKQIEKTFFLTIKNEKLKMKNEKVKIGDAEPHPETHFL